MSGKLKQSLLIEEADDFKQQEELGEGIYSKTIRVLQADTKDFYAMKTFDNLTGSQDLIIDKLYQIYNFLNESRYPFCLPPSYMIKITHSQYTQVIKLKDLSNQLLSSKCKQYKSKTMILPKNI